MRGRYGRVEAGAVGAGVGGGCWWGGRGRGGVQVGGAGRCGVWTAVAAFGAEGFFLGLWGERGRDALVDCQGGLGDASGRTRRTVGGPSLLPSLSSS